MTTKQCTKCNGNLKEGIFYVRNNDNCLFFTYTVWTEMTKEDYLRSSIKERKDNSIQYPLKTYRCENCGFIEFYATDVERWKH